MSSGSESHMLSRAEPSQSFIAGITHQEAGYTCTDCGLPILAGQLITEDTNWAEFYARALDDRRYWHYACIAEPDQED